MASGCPMTQGGASKEKEQGLGCDQTIPKRAAAGTRVQKLSVREVDS